MESEIVLGFLEEPANQAITQARFLPSKVGGAPAWISDKGVPGDRCGHCHYKLIFVMQLYANQDEEDPELHRMVYVFACLSPQCIGTERAVKVYRAYALDDPTVFAPEALYNKVMKAESIAELVKLGINLPKVAEEEDKDEEDDEGLVDLKNVGIELDEYLIETDLEQEKVTKFYLKESKKLLKAPAASKKSGMMSKVQVVQQNESSDEDDDDELEKAFVNNAMNGKKDEKRVENILKNIKETVGGSTGNDDDDKDLLMDDPHADTEESKVEARELEKIIQDKHSNFNKISRHYKLFEYIAKAEPDQVLRYVKQRSPVIEPLWMSEKCHPQVIPACPRCGSPRLFEFQIMPQIFDVLKELMLVDWSTIVIYSCSGSLKGKPCNPKFDAEFSPYIEEFAFIQFADDFSRVQLGDEKQIEKQRQMRVVQEKEEVINKLLEPVKKDKKTQEQTQQSTQAAGEEEKKTKKKNKKKAKGEEKPKPEDIQREQEAQLKDLMENFSLK